MSADKDDLGVPPSGSGCQPSASAVPASQSGIPNAACKDCRWWIANRQRRVLETYEAPHQNRTGWKRVLLGTGYDLWDAAIVDMRRDDAIKHNLRGTCHLLPALQTTTRDYWCSSFAAQAIEAGTGETGTGSTEGESAVLGEDAPNTQETD